MNTWKLIEEEKPLVSHTMCFDTTRKLLFTDGKTYYIGFCRWNITTGKENSKIPHWYEWEDNWTTSVRNKPIPNVTKWAELPPLE